MATPYITDRGLLTALEKSRESCRNNLNALISSSTGNNNVEAPSDPSGSSLTFATLRTDFLSLLALIYSHTTRLALGMKPPLTASAGIKYVTDLSTEVGRLVSCASAIGPSDGLTLRKEFVWATQEVAENVIALVEGFLGQADAEDKSYLRRTGAVHDAVDSVKRTLSSSNLEAVTKRWKADSGALDDALEEIKEMAEGGEAGADIDGNEDMDGWDEVLGEDAPKQRASPEETERMKKAYPLLRLTTLLHRRLLSHHISPLKAEHTSQYQDTLLAHSSTLVSTTDDLVASMYPPQDAGSIKTQLEFISDLFNTIKADMETDEVTRRLGEGLVLGEGSADDTELAKKRKKERQWFDVCFVQIEKAGDAFGPLAASEQGQSGA